MITETYQHFSILYHLQCIDYHDLDSKCKSVMNNLSEELKSVSSCLSYNHDI